MLQKTAKIKGILPALGTPVDRYEEIDETGLRRLVRHVINGGVHGLFVMGSMGGCAFFTEEKISRAIEIVVDEASGKIPVLAGVSDTATAKVIRNAKMAESLGANAIVAAPPYYFRFNRDQLIYHYKEIAESVSIPVYIYNLPGVTNTMIDMDLAIELSHIPNISGIKDSSTNFAHFLNLIDAFSGRDDFSVFQGDEQTIAASLMSGCDGGVIGTANLAPGLIVALYNAAVSGDIALANSLQKKWTSLMRIHSVGDLFAGFAGALEILGVCKRNVMSPVRPLTDEQMEKVKLILKELDII